MKHMYIFKNGQRIIGDTQALVFSQHPSFITKQYDLRHASDQEVKDLVKNPHNDLLLADIEKRREKRVK